MNEFEKALEEFKKDCRVECKYGVNCYQRNPTHRAKYKHLPKKEEQAGETHKKRPEKKLHAIKKRKLENNKGHVGVEWSDSSESESAKEDATIESFGSSSQRKEIISESSSSSQGSEDEDIIPPSEDEDNKVETPSISSRENIIPANNSTQETAQKPSPKGIHELFIKDKFLVDMPEDFYKFWEVCEKLNPTNPSEALKSVGLHLVGPYDVLAEKFKNVEKPEDEYLLHWRYYYDPPEFQTVLRGDDKTGYHIGYFRDVPNEPPAFLASNHGMRDGEFKKMGTNIFAAFTLYLEELNKTGGPFMKMNIPKFSGLVKKAAEKLGLNLSPHSEKIKKRNYKVVTNTRNKLGLVVPIKTNTRVGYRDLAMSDKDIDTLLNRLEKASPEQKTKVLSELQPVFTYADIACDEGDFGTAIKLGWDLMSHGINCLNPKIIHHLENGYNLLDRPEFAKIAGAHMKKRTKSCNLSII